MSAKDVKFGDNARSQMLDGVNTLANAVKVTLDQRVGMLYLISLLERQLLLKMAYQLQKK